MLGGDLANEVRAGGSEKLQADLVSRRFPADTVDDHARLFGALHVECYDHALLGFDDWCWCHFEVGLIEVERILERLVAVGVRSFQCLLKFFFQ